MAEYSEQFSTKPGFYVYRLWAADGTCLYVGCTGERGPKRVGSRLSAHKRSKPWWSQVARIDVASFANSAEVIAEEPRQVAALDPVHNKALRPHCAHGHDLTLPGARKSDGACAQCRRIWERKPVPMQRNRENVRRYLRTAEGRLRQTIYDQGRKARSRRPTPGQTPLW